jgi:hypothetical protein
MQPSQLVASQSASSLSGARTEGEFSLSVQLYFPLSKCEATNDGFMPLQTSITGTSYTIYPTLKGVVANSSEATEYRRNQKHHNLRHHQIAKIQNKKLTLHISRTMDRRKTR